MSDCPKATDRDLASLYLAGRLPREEAEAFEEHFFSCESCRLDVAAGSELRRHFGKSGVVPESRSDRGRGSWLPLAAAALIAVVGLGVWQYTRRGAPEAPSVFRGIGEGSLDLHMEARAGGSVEVTWAPHAGAATYVVMVLAPDETSVWKTETREPRLTLGPEVLQAPKPLRIEVEALDPMRQVVAKSEPVPLRTP